MNDVYSAIDRLIEYAIDRRNSLGSSQLGLQADITEAARVAGEYVAEGRHAEEMTDQRYAEDAAREPVTCVKCIDAQCLREVRNTLGRASEVTDDLFGLVLSRIDSLIHDEAEGCDHDQLDNFTSDGSDDGPDSEY